VTRIKKTLKRFYIYAEVFTCILLRKSYQGARKNNTKNTKRKGKNHIEKKHQKHLTRCI